MTGVQTCALPIYYCPEMITNIDELGKYSKNKIEIIKELHREEAIKILKERGE